MSEARRLLRILHERLSDTLYHYLKLPDLDSILSQNQFKLTAFIPSPRFNGPEVKLQANKAPKNRKNYYLCASRSRVGSFATNATTQGYPGAMLVLDGVKLGQRYSGQPVDFWAQTEYKDRRGWASRRGDPSSHNVELEDRLFSNSPVIPNASQYIKEIHILVGDDSKYDRWKGSLKRVSALAEQAGIPMWLYKRAEDFQALNKAKSIKLSDVDLEQVEPEETSRWQDPYDHFGLYLNLYSAGSYSELTDEAKKKLLYLEGSDDLEREMQNARKPGGKQDGVNKILQIMRKEKLYDVPAFIKFLAAKWDGIMKQEGKW